MLTTTEKPTYFQNKSIFLMVTDNCNLCCGGCSQLCPILDKKQQWNISLEDLTMNLEVLIAFKHKIALFGGEPTLHPQWKRIVEICASYDYPFTVFTNGTTPQRQIRTKNIHYRIERKNKNRVWMSPMRAMIDHCNCDKVTCAKMALRSCWLLHKKTCGSLIYDNRAYLCHPAGAFDRLLVGRENWQNSHGWKIIPGKDPFAQHPKKVLEQAEHLCYRCGFFMRFNDQRIGDKFVVSPTN